MSVGDYGTRQEKCMKTSPCSLKIFKPHVCDVRSQGDHKRSGGPKWGKRDNRDNNSEGVVERRNPRFESYYKVSEAFEHEHFPAPIVHLFQEQAIVPDSEWEDLLSTLRASLPVTFRLAGSRTWVHSLVVGFYIL